MKRIQFTKRELKMMHIMFAIANTNDWSDATILADVWEGDDARVVFESAWGKVMTLQFRCERKEMETEVSQLVRRNTK
jgi:hypothetical protein